MTSNIEECREVDSAKARLAAAKTRAESASQLLESAARTVGFVQLGAAQLRAGLGGTLVDSASKTMELAQSQFVCFQKEVKEAEKDLMSVEEKWEGSGVDSGCLPDYSSVKTLHPNALRKKRRRLSGSDEDDDGRNDNLNSDGGKKYAVLKKSKIDKTVRATSTFGTATATHTTGTLPFISNTANIHAAFTFGAVPAALPNGTFVFASNSAKGTTTSSSSTPAFSFATASVSPNGKRKLSDGRSTDDIAQAPKAVLESRKILKASRKWCKSRPGEATAGGKIASIFASVKLTPSTATDVKKGKERNSSAAAPTPSASASPAFSFPNPSSSTGTGKPPNKAPSNNKEEGTGDSGNLNKPKQEEGTEEETLYDVRAKRFKIVDGEWKKYATGVLRLYRHKRTSKCRMVIHNDIGQVQFNVRISMGMLFHKMIKETDKGKSAYVKFVAVEDVGRGMETFMLQVKPEFVDMLQQTLEGMAKNH